MSVTPSQKQNAISFFQKVIRGYLKVTFKECELYNSYMPLVAEDRGWTCANIKEILASPFNHCESNDRRDYVGFANADKGVLGKYEIMEFQDWLENVEQDELEEVIETAIRKRTTYSTKSIRRFMANHPQIVEGKDDLEAALSYQKA